MTGPVHYDSHMHTPLCKHSWGTPGEYASAAFARGLKGIIITCHNPGPAGWSQNVRMRMDQFDEYVAMVDRARSDWSGRVDVRLGLECDYIPSMESFLNDLLTKADFHHVLGSVHPMLPYYKEAFLGDDVIEFQRTYFRHLAQAAESGLFDTLAHPDLVKNVFPKQWDVDAMMGDIRESLDRIAKSGVAMELNTSGIHKHIKEMNPGPSILAEMRLRDIPVVLGSDAHTPHRVAAGYVAALDLLHKTGFTEVHYFLARKMHATPLEVVRRSLRHETMSGSTFPQPI